MSRYGQDGYAQRDNDWNQYSMSSNSSNTNGLASRSSQRRAGGYGGFYAGDERSSDNSGYGEHSQRPSHQTSIGPDSIDGRRGTVRSDRDYANRGMDRRGTAAALMQRRYNEGQGTKQIEGTLLQLSNLSRPQPLHLGRNPY
jgi:hypothetical protein